MCGPDDAKMLSEGMGPLTLLSIVCGGSPHFTPSALCWLVFHSAVSTSQGPLAVLRSHLTSGLSLSGVVTARLTWTSCFLRVGAVARVVGSASGSSRRRASA